MSLGVIPPKKKAYAATVYQVKVDPSIAPKGITVFGLWPHMHEIGKKIWVERLVRKPGSEGDLLRDLEELEKVSVFMMETGASCHDVLLNL